MSSGGSSTSTQQTSPWSGQQPYLLNLFKGAQGAYGQYSGNPQSSVAPLTAPQQQAIAGTQQMAGASNLGGVNATNAASDYTTKLENGQFLGSNPANAALSPIANGSMLSPSSNPYMQAMANAAGTNLINQYQTAIAPQLTSEFEGAGRYGSGAMTNAQNMAQQGFATQLANAQNNLYGSMYNQNEANQLSALGQLGSNYNTAAQQQLQGSYNAPGLQAANTSLLGSEYGMGGNQQAYQQALLNSPFSLLGQYGSLIGGNYGSSSVASQPYYTNPLAGGMGGAVAGAELGSVVPGIGTGIGAGIGGALGLLMG